MKRFFLFAFAALPLSLAAQTFVQAEFLEAGLSPCGSFGTADDPPAGYHPNNTFLGGLGLVGDLEKDGWDIGEPNQYCGDYFLPGAAVEGFSIEADGNVFISGNQGAVCSESDFGLSGYNEITSGGAKLLKWSRSANDIAIRQSSVFIRNRLLVINKVDLCNESAATLSDVYYQRNADPDPAQPWGGGFATRNAIKFFGPGVGTAVTASSSGVVGGVADIDCYMGLASGDPRAVASFGGFNFGIPSDAVNAVPPYSLSGSAMGDVSVQMTFELGDIAAGSCECFAWAYVLDRTEAVDAWKATRIACPAVEAFERDGDADALAAAMFGDNYDEAQRAFAWTAETGGFRLLDLEGNEQISVYDLGGRLVHQGIATADVHRITQLSPGLYAVQLQAPDGSVRSGKAMAY